MMRSKAAPALLALALIGGAGSACATDASSAGDELCRVVDADKLPPESGGADALCGAIREAAVAQDVGAQFAVEVRVLSSSLLSATVTTPSGERLPEQRLVSADRELRASSFRRFAQSLVRLARQAAR